MEGDILDKLNAEAVKQSLQALEDKPPALEADALTTGEVDLELSVPVTKGPQLFKGGRVSVFVQTKVQQLKAAVGGVRFRKEFK